MQALWLLPIVAAASCATAPSPLADINGYWLEAQQQLVKAGFKSTRVYSVKQYSFAFVMKPGKVMCNGQLVDGCYNTAGTITYNVQASHVIIHEAGHAILHHMGYSCWKGWGHEGGCKP